MEVMLSDPVIQVNGWTSDLDKVGDYTLKIRKSPAELAAERKYNSEHNIKVKIDPMNHIRKSVLTHDEQDPSIVYFLPGLWPRVKRMLDGKGLTYTMVDKRNPAIRPDLDVGALEGVELRKTQDVALALLAKADCGIIETTTAYGKSFIISMLCKALPTLNIVVTTASSQVVSTLYEYLCKTIPGQVGVLYAGRNTVAGKRVVVTTLKSLPNIPPDNVQLVLVDECHAIGDNLAGHELMKFCWARRLGFSASPIRNDGTAKVMESILGPTILKMSYDEAVDAGMVTPMKYLMLPCGGCPNVAKNPDIPEYMLKRWSYWCNKSRNDVIRRFVCDLKQVYDGQILIMVGTLEHAIQLQMMLPWFKVAYYGASDLKDIERKFPKDRYPGFDINKIKMRSGDLDRMRNAFAKGTLRYVVATKTWKQGVNFTKLAVLIRADGDTSEVEGIQIPGRLARLDEDKKWSYIIDVHDTFSPWALRRSQAREKLYQKQQWKQCSYQEVLDDLSRRTKDDGQVPSGE